VIILLPEKPAPISGYLLAFAYFRVIFPDPLDFGLDCMSQWVWSRTVASRQNVISLPEERARP